MVMTTSRDWYLLLLGIIIFTTQSDIITFMNDNFFSPFYRYKV